MDENTHSRHFAESSVRLDIDRLLKLTGTGLVAAMPIRAASWTGPAAQTKA